MHYRRAFRPPVVHFMLQTNGKSLFSQQMRECARARARVRARTHTRARARARGTIPEKTRGDATHTHTHAHTQLQRAARCPHTTRIATAAYAHSNFSTSRNAARARANSKLGGKFLHNCHLHESDFQTRAKLV